MGRTGSTHEGEATYIHIYRGVGGVGEDLGVDGDNIKEDFQKKNRLRRRGLTSTSSG